MLALPVLHGLALKLKVLELVGGETLENVACVVSAVLPCVTTPGAPDALSCVKPLGAQITAPLASPVVVTLTSSKLPVVLAPGGAPTTTDEALVPVVCP